MSYGFNYPRNGGHRTVGIEPTECASRPGANDKHRTGEPFRSLGAS